MKISECFLALERLLNGNPIKIVGPYKINNDTVSVEAGYPRGSIKKYNPTHELLIKNISENYGKKYKSSAKPHKKLKDQQQKIKTLQTDINDAIGREAMYIKYILELEAALLKTGNVVPIK